MAYLGTWPSLLETGCSTTEVWRERQCEIFQNSLSISCLEGNNEMMQPAPPPLLTDMRCADASCEG